MKETGFGIIGCGMISSYHAQSIQEINGARLVGFADVNAEAARASAAKFAVRPFETVERLLECDDIEIVSICVPNGLHAKVAIAALDAGKNVVLEKPMCISVKECDEIIDKCEQTGKLLTVISQFRYEPYVEAIKNAVDSGALGRLTLGSVSTNFFREPQYYKQAAWRGTWNLEGGGALINQGIHGLDILTHIMGDVKSVTCLARTVVHKIEVEDTLCATLEFCSGALGTVTAATTAYPGYPRRMEIYGAQGSVITEGETVLKWNVPQARLPENVDYAASVHKVAGDPAASMNDLGHLRQLENFVSCVRDNTRPDIDKYEGAKTIRYIMAMYEANITKKQVDIK